MMIIKSSWMIIIPIAKLFIWNKKVLFIFAPVLYNNTDRGDMLWQKNKWEDKMKRIGRVLALALTGSFLLTGCTGNISASIGTPDELKDTIYQVSTLNSLLMGNYDGYESVEVLKNNGDLGIGTFDTLDGEMVMIDGKVYKVKSTGEVVEVEDSVTVPFAAVTYFERDRKVTLSGMTNLDTLKLELDKQITDKDMFYAIRIDGVFQDVKVRSVPKQEKPYPVLTEITKNQPVYEYKDVKGSLVGFWCPEYVGGTNVPGYHLHFISEDRSQGGHLLDVSFESAEAALDISDDFHMSLTQGEAQGTISNLGDEIEGAEKGK